MPDAWLTTQVRGFNSATTSHTLTQLPAPPPPTSICTVEHSWPLVLIDHESN